MAVAVLVREAIDQQIPQDAEQRRSARQAILDAEPMAVPEPGPLSRGAGPESGVGGDPLDTTILIYALGDEHQYRDPSRHLLELIRDGEQRASTTIEVIQEFCQVRSRRRPRREAAARALEYAKGLAPLILVEEPELRSGLELFAASAALSPFDAVLAAAALHRGWALASADRTFAEVQRLVHLDPKADAFLSSARELS